MWAICFMFVNKRTCQSCDNYFYVHSSTCYVKIMDVIDTRRLLDKIYDKCDHDYGIFNCLIWTGATYDDKYGKMRNPLKKYKDQPTYMRTHRMVYLLHNIEHFKSGFLPKSDSNGDNLDVSHICHNTLCVNINHLTLESHLINCSRNECVSLGKCTDQHFPACLI